MDAYRHHVSGFFAHREEAEIALNRLVDGGFAKDRLQIFDADTGPAVTEPKGESNEVLTNVLVDGAVGTAVGTGVGVLTGLALEAASVTLFIASPLVAPLVILGWGASLGGIVGAAAGAQKDVKHKEGWLSDLVHDAIANNQVVLVAQALSEEETEAAREVIESAVGEYQDLATTV